METWDLLESPAAAAPFNMALDEALLHGASARGRPLLRVYAWTEPTASFGYFQKFPSHLAAAHQLVRRPTGGGVVYHGADTTYTVIAPPDDALGKMKTAAAYEVIHRAVAVALASSFVGAVSSSDQPQLPPPGAGPTLHLAPVSSPSGQYECFQKPVQGDVVLAGRKLAGGAQRRSKWGLLHQGSIAARLTVGQLTAGFREVLGVTFVAYRLDPGEEQAAAQLAVEKYATDAWNKRTV